MRVHGPRVLVRPIDPPRPKSSLLYIPETVEAESSPYALVVSVGSGALLRDGTRRPLDVKPGDTVIVKKYSLNGVEVNGEPCAVVMESDILAVVEFS